MKSSNFILFTGFLAISFCMNAQTIEGNYQVEDIQMAVADMGITYSFKPDGTFRKTIHEHLDNKTISGGTFELLEDTLKLNYIRLNPDLSNPVKILKKEALKSSTDTSFNPLFSKIKVFNSQGEPQPGVHLILQNDEKKPVMAFVSDSIGDFPYISIYDNYIKELQFSFLSHQEAYLKTDSLFNYQTEIEIRLNDSSREYNNTKQSFSFLIKPSQEKIELIPLKGNEKDKLILAKVE